MKKVFAVLVSFILLGSFALAQAADEQKAAQPSQEMPMMDHQMMNGGKGMMDCPVMKPGDGKSMMISSMMKGGMMKEHHMMMHDMMQMMKDMMAVQKNMLASPSAEDKAKLDKELSVMMEKMDKLMTSSKCMMMNDHKPAAGDQNKEETAPMEHKH